MVNIGYVYKYNSKIEQLYVRVIRPYGNEFICETIDELSGLDYRGKKDWYFRLENNPSFLLYKSEEKRKTHLPRWL